MIDVCSRLWSGRGGHTAAISRGGPDFEGNENHQAVEQPLDTEYDSRVSEYGASTVLTKMKQQTTNIKTRAVDYLSDAAGKVRRQCTKNPEGYAAEISYERPQ